MRKRIVLTGGPGGGKSAFIEQLSGDRDWRGRFLALPEAIAVVGRLGISPCERAFQRLMVEIQRALEDALDRALQGDEARFVLCDRGTLDPLAYWLDRGWDEAQFFDFTHTSREEHYGRYLAVIHLVTAADGASGHYVRWSRAHRPEGLADALRIDRLLGQVWGGHSSYHRLGNVGRPWAAKAQEARALLERYCATAK
jgi:hypothetical protein